MLSHNNTVNGNRILCHRQRELVQTWFYLLKTHEVSPTLQLPFYPVVLGIAVACVLECLVMIADIIKIVGGHMMR